MRKGPLAWPAGFQKKKKNGRPNAHLAVILWVSVWPPTKSGISGGWEKVFWSVLKYLRAHFSCESWNFLLSFSLISSLWLICRCRSPEDIEQLDTNREPFCCTVQQAVPSKPTSLPRILLRPVRGVHRLPVMREQSKNGNAHPLPGTPTRLRQNERRERQPQPGRKEMLRQLRQEALQKSLRAQGAIAPDGLQPSKKCLLSVSNQASISSDPLACPQFAYCTAERSLSETIDLLPWMHLLSRPVLRILSPALSELLSQCIGPMFR